MFISNDSDCLARGDNIFYGRVFTTHLRKAVMYAKDNNKATAFGYWVCDSEPYGVAEFDHRGNCLSIKSPRNQKATMPL